MSELTIKDFKSKYQPIGLSMELKSQGQSAYETGKIGGHTPLYTDEQIQDYLSNQPQLTIPKSIADELDKVEMNWNTLKDEAQGWPTDDLIMWLDDGNNPLMFAYLAGKEFGVELVEVTDD